MRLRISPCTSFAILFAFADQSVQFSKEPLNNRGVGISFTEIRMSSESSNAPKCAPCSGLDDSAKLSFDEAEVELASLGERSSLWDLMKSQDGILSLSRKFTARNFQAGVDAINAVASIAEEENHHPDLHLTNYREVEVQIYTHKVKGLTRNDFILASRINDVLIDYSPKWLRENPLALSTSKSDQGRK